MISRVLVTFSPSRVLTAMHTCLHQPNGSDTDRRGKVQLRRNRCCSVSESEVKDGPVSTHTQVARNFFGESSSYSSFDPAKELGVQEPIGFWDPLGLSADKDEATFKRRRAVEIKHGRIVSFPSFQFWFLSTRFVEDAGCVMHAHLCSILQIIALHIWVQ